MTGFAAKEGAFEYWTWSAELRAVNGKGLDVRLRLPDWIEGLEAQARGLLTKTVKRGNVTLSLRLARNDAASPMSLNAGNLDAAINALKEIETRAEAAGLPLATPTAVEVAAMRGVLEQATDDREDATALRTAILADVAELAREFDAMRAQEGAAILNLLTGQLEEVAELSKTAKVQAEARKEHTAETLRANLKKVMDGAAGVDEARVAQELALIAVKSDVTEELDRLRAHIDAAKALLEEGRIVGRKFDFLMQEFNREANTLCSKSQNADLTKTGLALKVLIDQMREQVQNVE